MRPAPSPFGSLRPMGWKRGVALGLCVLWMVGCSCEEETVPDGGLADAGPGATDSGPSLPDGGDAGPAAGRCGNGELNAGETCDDGNRDNGDGCNDMCQLECGDGMVQPTELCDTGIPAGMPGACPTDCDDGMACTTDALSGADCAAECVHGDITIPVNGDGCCPAGATSSADDDCAAMCGNMILEAGEACEDGTAMPCPTSCDDGNTCTTDALTGAAASCDAVCTNTAITACSTTSDGCCPTGCDSATDADCSATCGNGIFEPPTELCEDGTAMPCRTSCDDGMACTVDTLIGSAAMCNVQCTNAAITACSATSDGCCPGVCTAVNDADCMPVCGNSAIEAGENCDDGNTVSGDGCSSTCQREAVAPTAFRINNLDLRDPHAFVPIIGSFCTDQTSMLNSALSDSMTMDTDGPGGAPDGLLDLSFLVVFRPLAQSATGGTLDLIDAACTAPVSSTMCSRMVSIPALASGSYTNQTTGTCLTRTAGGVTVTSGFTPSVVEPTAPCFVTAAQNLTLNLGGVVLNLRDAQLGATYVGAPATSLRNGLIRGFITEADADATTLPAGLPIVGGMPLSRVLRGATMNPCTGSDIDMHPVHGPGWWFFANFAPTSGPGASLVPYTEM